MQAILTKYLAATDRSCSRIKASCLRGSLIMPYRYDLSAEGNHLAAREALVHKFLAEDSKLGIPVDRNFWGGIMVHGSIKDGTWAHVFTSK